MAALGFEVMFGSLTITGSFMAFGKLQGFIPSAADDVQIPKPIEYRPVFRGRAAVHLR